METVTINKQTGEVINEGYVPDKAFDEENRSPYDSFVQVNLKEDCNKARLQLIKTNPSAYAVFDYLMTNADIYNAVICSVKVLEEALGYSERTIYRAVEVLREKKFIDIKKSGTANVYLLNKELVWKSRGKNYKYAEFGAKVIISESEQEKPVIKRKRMTVLTLKEDSQPRGKDSQQTEDDVWEDSLPDEGEPPEE